MRARVAMIVMTVGLGLAGVACGGGEDEATVATRPAAPTPASTSTVVAATTGAPLTTRLPATTTAAPTTAEPATTAAATTPAPTAAAPTTVAPPAGWQPVDFTPAATPVGYSGNWTGTPSPAVAAGAATLPDGYYHATLLSPWDPADPAVLHVELRRFGFCRDLPPGTCEENPDDPDELGLDPAWSQQVDVALDATTSVVVDGLTCERDVKRGTGADLGELFTAFHSAYTSLIGPQVLGGVEDIEIAQSFGGETVQGFTADQTLCPEQYAGVLHFQHGSSPSLLLQVLLRYNADGPPSLLAPTDVAVLNGVQVQSGVPTYYFYAGFIS
jgi:hypothetical protein